jgi:hypothetical protein
MGEKIPRFCPRNAGFSQAECGCAALEMFPGDVRVMEEFRYAPDEQGMHEQAEDYFREKLRLYKEGHLSAT